MKKCYLLFFILAVSGLQVFAQTKFKQNKINGFIENKGQLKDQNGNTNSITKYLLNINGLKIQLRNNGFSYDTYTTEKTENTLANVKNEAFNFFQNNVPEEAISKFHRVDIDFLNINPNPQIIAENMIENNINYFISATPQTGIKDVKMYGKITYKNIYPNIDLEFVAGSNKEKPVEYNFIVHPGADASKIKWTYAGSDEISLVNEQIHIKTINGILTENIPLTYEKETQKIGKAKYQLNQDGSFGFEIENYNKNKTLIIDPVPFIDWCTYYGGEEDEIFVSVKTDDSGYVYVMGQTDSKTNIATTGAYQTNLNITYDVILAKFTGSGKRIWCTYFGGTKTEIGTDMIMDNMGNIFISGTTRSSQGLADSGAFMSYSPSLKKDNSCNDCEDVFIGMFDNDGHWKWGTYFGGEGIERGFINKDKDGYLYLAGYTTSKTNIAYGKSHQDTIESKTDAYLVKFDDSCRSIIWSTYYGGKGADYFISITYDKNKNNFYLAGSTNSTTNVATPGTYKSTYSAEGKQGLFVCFDTNGKRKWGSYYGGFSDDGLINISVDDTGNMYLLGYSESTEAIATIGSHQFQNGGQQDFFLVKMDSLFKRKWGTFYGGSGFEEIAQLQMNDSGDIYIAGTTNSMNQISTHGTPKPVGDAIQRDIVVAKFSNAGKLKWGTYYGTDGNYDAARNLTIDKFGNIYVVGNTYSTTNFTTLGVQQEKFNGLYDAYILRLSENCNNYEIEGQKIQDMTCNGLEDGKATVKLISALPIQKYVWSNGDTTEVIEGLTAGWYKFIATDNRGCSRTDSVQISEPAQLSIGNMTGKNTTKKVSNETYSIPSQSNVNYKWEITNGTIQSGQGTNNIQVLWGNNNTGKVKAVIYTYIHCGDSNTLDIVLEDNAGIDQWHMQNRIKLYPNPASESVMISLEDEKLLNSNFEISDNAGRVIQKGIFNQLNTKIDISGFASGMYFLSAENYKIKILIVK